MKLNWSSVNQIYDMTHDTKTKEYAIVTQFQNGERLLILENHTGDFQRHCTDMLHNISLIHNIG